MPKKRSWSDEDLKEAVNNSHNMREVINYLGLAVSGGQYANLKKHMNRLNLEFELTAEERKLSGIEKYKFTRTFTNEEVFCVNPECSRHVVRDRYESLFKQICSECDISDWNGQSLKMDLDHINGDRNDNRLENLRWLCPNCHRQTNTWGNKHTRVAEW